MDRQNREALVNALLQPLEGHPSGEVLTALPYVVAIVFRSLEMDDVDDALALFTRQVKYLLATLKPSEGGHGLHLT